MNSVLERLYVVRDYMDPENYDYEQWSSCTCGHIYRAATGRQGAPKYDLNIRDDVVSREGPMYTAMLRACCDALGLLTVPSPDQVSLGCNHTGFMRNQVSAKTRDLARRYGGDHFKAAMYIINKTIEVEEAKNEAARLDVLTQMETVVNEVPIEGVACVS